MASSSQRAPHAREVDLGAVCPKPCYVVLSCLGLCFAESRAVAAGFVSSLGCPVLEFSLSCRVRPICQAAFGSGFTYLQQVYRIVGMARPVGGCSGCERC